jgi:two-component system, response regulator, stage 0 sporulation protein F
MFFNATMAPHFRPAYRPPRKEHKMCHGSSSLPQGNQRYCARSRRGKLARFLMKPVGMKNVTCAVAESFAGKRAVTTPSAREILHTMSKNSPRHVLVVDDEPLIRWSVAESLSDLGFDVEEAGDASSALRKVTTAATPFDVVVLDLRLPDMDDLSLLGTLRQLLPSAALVLMTAFGNPDVFANAAAMGASVLHKPFELDELKEVVLHSGADTN